MPCDGRRLRGVVGYWFAWYAFNPTTAIFLASSPTESR
jgi:hypothetical protein